MANGGWYGTKEEWERLEAPLVELDPILTRFAGGLGLGLSKNHKESPNRSISWGVSPSCLIQLYLADQEQLTWNLWVCCTQDRENQRFWKRTFLFERQLVSEFRGELPDLLTKGRNQLVDWSKRPETLEFATEIAVVR